MPIVERDPWRMQYFEQVACPEELFIPTEDSDAYRLFPRHRWIYNKLLVAESQGLDAGPHGLPPERFPVFSKPIYNLRGMGIESRVLALAGGVRARADRRAPVDAAARRRARLVRRGRGRRRGALVAPHDRPAARGRDVRLLDGRSPSPDPSSSAPAAPGWRENLRGYTGAVNLETIGGTIIECHLRFADQWPDLYGAGWLDALVALYRDGRWSYDDRDRRTGYSVVLFGGHGLRYRPVDPDRGRGAPGPPGGLERPDHLPPGQAAGAPRHAPGRVPPGDRQLLGPRSRPRRAPPPGAPALVHPAPTPPPPRAGWAALTAFAARRPSRASFAVPPPCVSSTLSPARSARSRTTGSRSRTAPAWRPGSGSPRTPSGSRFPPSSSTCRTASGTSPAPGTSRCTATSPATAMPPCGSTCAARAIPTAC